MVPHACTGALSTCNTLVTRCLSPPCTGEDFDQRVMEYFIKLIKKKHSVDVSKDARALQKLRREAERAKRALSSQHQVGGGLPLTLLL
jgi:Hsp70 protein